MSHFIEPRSLLGSSLIVPTFVTALLALIAKDSESIDDALARREATPDDPVSEKMFTAVLWNQAWKELSIASRFLLGGAGYSYALTALLGTFMTQSSTFLWGVLFVAIWIGFLSLIFAYLWGRGRFLRTFYAIELNTLGRRE